MPWEIVDFEQLTDEEKLRATGALMLKVQLNVAEDGIVSSEFLHVQVEENHRSVPDQLPEVLVREIGIALDLLVRDTGQLPRPVEGLPQGVNFQFICSVSSLAEGGTAVTLAAGSESAVAGLLRRGYSADSTADFLLAAVGRYAESDEFTLEIHNKL